MKRVIFTGAGSNLKSEVNSKNSESFLGVLGGGDSVSKILKQLQSEGSAADKNYHVCYSTPYRGLNLISLMSILHISGTKNQNCFCRGISTR